MRSTVAGRAPGTTSGTVVLTWPKPTLDASTAMNAIAVTRCAVLLGTVMLPARDRKDVALLRVQVPRREKSPDCLDRRTDTWPPGYSATTACSPRCLGPTNLQPKATRN